MDFKYRNNKSNSIENVNLTVGMEWSKQKVYNHFMNTIFDAVDSNKDGILQENEYHKLNGLFNLVDGTENKDKILSDKELDGLIKKIKNNEIDMSAIQSESMLKINPNEFNEKNLEKRYPTSKYVHSYKYSNGKINSITITNLQSNKPAISIDYDKQGFYITEYDKNGDEEYFYNYSSNGVLNFYDTNLNKNNSVRQYPIIDAINKDICAKNKFGLPTTGKDIWKHISYISKDNVITLLQEYSAKYGEDLICAINNEYGLDRNIKNKIINHIKKCYEELYGYKNNFRIDDSQTTTKWHKGDKYSIENKNDIIIIKNKNKGKTRIINLNELVKNLDLRGQAAVKAQLVNLPGEVLMDIAIEVTSFQAANELDRYVQGKHIAAYYRHLTDNITLGVAETYDISDSIVHELGHAVDFTGNFLKRCKSSNSDNYKKLTDAFNRELAAYVAKGGHVYDESKQDNNFMVNSYIRKDGGSNISVYATRNIHECFAECYMLLTTGSCDSADLLEDFFPQTLKAAEEMLNYIRSLDDSERH